MCVYGTLNDGVGEGMEGGLCPKEAQCEVKLNEV